MKIYIKDSFNYMSKFVYLYVIDYMLIFPSCSGNQNLMTFFDISSAFRENEASKPTIEGKNRQSPYRTDYKGGLKGKQIRFSRQNGSRVKLSAMLIEKSSFFCWHYRNHEISWSFTWTERSKSGKKSKQKLGSSFFKWLSVIKRFVEVFFKIFSI